MGNDAKDPPPTASAEPAEVGAGGSDAAKLQVPDDIFIAFLEAALFENEQLGLGAAIDPALVARTAGLDLAMARNCIERLLAEGLGSILPDEPNGFQFYQDRVRFALGRLQRAFASRPRGPTFNIQIANSTVAAFTAGDGSKTEGTVTSSSNALLSRGARASPIRSSAPVQDVSLPAEVDDATALEEGTGSLPNKRSDSPLETQAQEGMIVRWLAYATLVQFGILTAEYVSLRRWDVAAVALIATIVAGVLLAWMRASRANRWVSRVASYVLNLVCLLAPFVVASRLGGLLASGFVSLLALTPIVSAALDLRVSVGTLHRRIFWAICVVAIIFLSVLAQVTSSRATFLDEWRTSLRLVALSIALVALSGIVLIWNKVGMADKGLNLRRLDRAVFVPTTRARSSLDPDRRGFATRISFVTTISVLGSTLPPIFIDPKLTTRAGFNSREYPGGLVVFLCLGAVNALGVWLLAWRWQPVRSHSLYVTLIPFCGVLAVAQLGLMPEIPHGMLLDLGGFAALMCLAWIAIRGMHVDSDERAMPRMVVIDRIRMCGYMQRFALTASVVGATLSYCIQYYQNTQVVQDKGELAILTDLCAFVVVGWLLIFWVGPIQEAIIAQRRLALLLENGR